MRSNDGGARAAGMRPVRILAQQASGRDAADRAAPPVMSMDAAA
jgi:hypothetical protein